MAPFYGWGSTASRLEPLLGDSLLFTTEFTKTPGAQRYDTHWDAKFGSLTFFTEFCMVELVILCLSYISWPFYAT